jgi:hypothetical protein
MVTTLNLLMPVLLGVVAFTSFDLAYGQSIVVNQTEPCFLNYTAGYRIWDNCGMDEDYLAGALLGFEWVTGGYFSMIFAGVLILITYIKYHKAIYPLIIGVSFIPISYFLFPDVFAVFVVAAIAATLFAALYKIVKRHTSDFN